MVSMIVTWDFYSLIRLSLLDFGIPSVAPFLYLFINESVAKRINWMIHCSINWFGIAWAGWRAAIGWAGGGERRG